MAAPLFVDLFAMLTMRPVPRAMPLVGLLCNVWAGSLASLRNGLARSIAADGPGVFEKVSWQLCRILSFQLWFCYTIRLLMSCSISQAFCCYSPCVAHLDLMAAVPKQLGTPEDTFTALALQFNFDQRIKDKIIELGIRTLAEFRHYARNEDEVKRLFIDTITGPSYEEMQGRLQSARLRFAWTACKALLDSEHAALHWGFHLGRDR